MWFRRLRDVLFISLALVTATVPATASSSVSQKPHGAYSLNLLNLFVSHGTLTPPFQPNVLDYSVTLLHAHDVIDITPEIDESLPEYQGGPDNLPVITLAWQSKNNPPETASVAVRRQIDLPDQGETLTVYISVAHPRNLQETKIYSVTIYQSQREAVVGLKSLDGIDSTGAPIKLSRSVSTDVALYDVYVRPEAESVTLQPRCASGNWVTINGRTASTSAGLQIPREKDHYRQTVEIICGEYTTRRKYIVFVFSSWAADAIPPPRLLVTTRGRDCIFNEKMAVYRCPNPKAANYQLRLSASLEPTIRYTIESSDGTVQVRLFNDVPSMSFPYVGVGQFRLIGQAGSERREWIVQFNGVSTHSALRIFGWILGALLLLLLLSLLSVLGLSNTFGIGTPIGVTEVATAMTLMLQYFCFTGALRGVNIMGDMTEALKWVTLFWPLPWNMTLTASSLSSWGDVTDIANAYGCLFWSGIILGLVALLHAFTSCRLKCRSSNYTYPHRMKFGNWEQRVLHGLVFPVSVASSMILRHPDSKLHWKLTAGSLLAAFLVWTITVMAVIKTRIAQRRVIWVWQSSVREDGELEDEAGYWSDVHCDQLLTQPINRSLLKWLFPWRWVATVADIEPVNICPRTYARDEEEALYPVNEYNRNGQREPSYPLGKNPKVVDVVLTAVPNQFCPGQRLIAGLMRTDWLDVLFTYQGITHFNAAMTRNGHDDFVIPLTVKTCQLTGPITGGVNHFFYDGTRIPLIRIGDALYRLVMGVLLGVAFALQNYTVDAAVFASIGLISVGLLLYHIIGKPYTRLIENWVLGILIFTITMTSFSFAGYATQSQKLALATDIMLWLASGASLILAAYAGLVIFSTYSAVMCPPLEETRFLEELANCNVTISDHEEEWAVEVPAYNKRGARDLKAQCNLMKDAKLHVSVYPSGEEPTIEFNANEMLQACRSGSLRAPVLSLFLPDPLCTLGYRHTNVYSKQNLHADVAGFLAIDRTLRHMADSLARNIAHQVDVRGRGKAVVSLTIIPPKLSNSSALLSEDDAVSSSYDSRTESTTSRQRSKYSAIEMTRK